MKHLLFGAKVPVNGYISTHIGCNIMQSVESITTRDALIG